MNLARGVAIEATQDTVKIVRAAAVGSFAQSLSQVFRAFRARKESFEQGAKVESSSADNEWQTTAGFDLSKHLPRLAGIFAGGNVLCRCNVIEHVMADTGTLGGGGLGGSNLKLAVHGDRIAIHDLAVEALRKRQGKRGLAASGWAKHNQEQRIKLRRSHRQRMLQ